MKYIILLLAAGSILLSSCATYFYAPNSANVPLLREKGESRATASSAAAEYLEGVEVQLVHSPVQHLGLMLNHYSAWNHGSKGGNGHFTEAGAGYYLPFHENFSFETYGLFGLGSAYNRFDSVESMRNSIKKYSVALSLGYRRRHFEAGISLKPAYVRATLKELNFVSYNRSSIYELINTPNSFLMEGSVFVRAGFERLKFQVMFTSSSNLTNRDFPQVNEMLSAGLTYLFNPFKGKAGKL